MHRRMRAAVAALLFAHRKLAAAAVMHGEGFAAQLEAGRSRTATVIVRVREPEETVADDEFTSRR